ncbi:MAG: histidine kinase [Clostridium sp.]|nr:histidine kinase [Clostridium sp.]
MKTKKVGNYILQFVFAILGLASCLIFYSFKINYFDLEADKIALTLSLVFLSFIVLIEFVSMFIIYDSTYHTFVSSLFILLCYLFSPDVIDIVYYGVEIAPIIQYVISSVHFLLFIASVFFTLNFVDFRYKIFVGSFNKMIVLLFSLGCFILYCVLNYFGYGIFVLAIYAIATMLFCINNQRKITDDDFIFYVCENIVFALLGMELFFQIADILKVETYGVGLFYAFSIVILYISIYVYFIFSNVKRALKSYEYEKELKELESEVLMKQINPHFLFNCLNAVQNIYHEN